ncbi:hypothetical protein F183_A54930 (plasmid) [Bryobacterales bacterium F-183]|nr:hypothetical protein F183_A54930 [Bryobacterales bacterium F-183]
MTMWKQLDQALREVAANGGTVPALEALQNPAAWMDRLKAARPADAAGQDFERSLLARAAIASIPQIAALNLPEGVQQKLYQAWLSFSKPDPAFALEHPWFVHWAAVATLRRFPAGQLDYVVDGFPRSWITRAPLQDWPGLASALMRLGGFRPCYFTHVGLRRPSKYSLNEKEANRSYWLVAQALKNNPEVRGLVTASWFHATETFRVSPHLAWFNETPRAGGAFFTTCGPADLDSGVFERSPERKKLYEEGKFTPLTGVMIWPRRDLIAWADRTPEAASS